MSFCYHKSCVANTNTYLKHPGRAPPPAQANSSRLWWHTSRQAFFLMTLTGLSWVMFSSTLWGEADGIASSTHLGVNDYPTCVAPISVDPLGERSISVEFAPEDWHDRRGQCAMNLIISIDIIPEKSNHREHMICNGRGWSGIKISLDK